MGTSDAAREVLVAELLGDLNTLYRAVQALKPVLAAASGDLVAQCTSLRQDSAQLQDRLDALVLHTQRGAVTHLVAKANEVTVQACADIRRSMNASADEAWRGAPARRLELLASQLQTAVTATAGAPGSRQSRALLVTALGACLLGCAAGFVVGALTVAALLHLV
jgi:hypothetical protein